MAGIGLSVANLLRFVKQNWMALTGVVLVIVTALSLSPLDQLPPVPGSDKTHHLIAYAVLMFPVALRKPKKWLLIGVAFIAYSGVIELIQPYVNRYAEWLDLAANATGVMCGALIAEGLNRLFPVSSAQV